jgi:hypothetical protein
MRRTSLAAWLALPLLLTIADRSSAQTPPRYGAYGMNIAGIPLTTFSRIHQHGPLYNYGPYYGYPPFEPYGPWNAYLQYNPWYYGDPNAQEGGGHHSLLGGHFGHGEGGCATCGGGLHATWLHGGWFHGSGGCPSCGHAGLLAGHTGWLEGHIGGGHCSSCKGVAFNPETTDPTSRLAGAGNPLEFAGFYSNLPSLSPVITADGTK